MERGAAVLETGAGAIEFGIREGTAAFLDMRTRAGSVSQPLTEVRDAGDAKETLKVRARAGMGDIAVRRA